MMMMRMMMADPANGHLSTTFHFTDHHWDSVAGCGLAGDSDLGSDSAREVTERDAWWRSNSIHPAFPPKSAENLRFSQALLLVLGQRLLVWTLVWLDLGGEPDEILGYLVSLLKTFHQQSVFLKVERFLNRPQSMGKVAGFLVISGHFTEKLWKLPVGPCRSPMLEIAGQWCWATQRFWWKIEIHK